MALQETSQPLEATELARHAVNRGAKVVIAVGGDGTVNEVANGLVNTDVALGVLPVGTTNSWALQMGIPALNPMLPSTKVVKLITDLEERIARPLPANYYRKVLLDAARVLVEGHTVAVDTGEISGRYFLMWAGIGLDAAIVESISLKEKRALGSWAYVFPAVKLGYRYPGTDVWLNLDGKVVKTNSPLVVVSNIQLYGGVMIHGFDSVWLGILITMTTLMGSITPPFGLVVFTISGIVKDVPMWDIFMGAFPYFLAMVFTLILIILVPDIALFLVRTMMAW